MKRLALVIVALCFAWQASAGILPKFRIGVRAGMEYQMTNFKSEVGNIDFKSSTGWHAGVATSLSWGGFGIYPELSYSHNKFDVKGYDGSMKLSRLDLPVLLGVNLLPFLTLQAGPTFNLMTDVGGSTEGAKWDLNNPTMGYALGAMLRVWKISVSARYNGAFEKSEVFGYATGENKISTLQLGVGFNF